MNISYTDANPRHTANTADSHKLWYCNPSTQHECLRIATVVSVGALYQASSEGHGPFSFDQICTICPWASNRVLRMMLKGYNRKIRDRIERWWKGLRLGAPEERLPWVAERALIGVQQKLKEHIYMAENVTRYLDQSVLIMKKAWPGFVEPPDIDRVHEISEYLRYRYYKGSATEVDAQKNLTDNNSMTKAAMTKSVIDRLKFAALAMQDAGLAFIEQKEIDRVREISSYVRDRFIAGRPSGTMGEDFDL